MNSNWLPLINLEIHFISGIENWMMFEWKRHGMKTGLKWNKAGSNQTNLNEANFHKSMPNYNAAMISELAEFISFIPAYFNPVT